MIVEEVEEGEILSGEEGEIKSDEEEIEIGKSSGAGDRNNGEMEAGKGESGRGESSGVKLRAEDRNGMSGGRLKSVVQKVERRRETQEEVRERLRISDRKAKKQRAYLIRKKMSMDRKGKGQ